MSKLLVNTPEGVQEVIEVGEGGGYFEDDRVLWDTRSDGALPSGIVLGGMVRVPGPPPSLAVDADLLAASEAAKLAALWPVLCRQLDDAVAAIYAVPTRFADEYKLREGQAQAFKDGGYVGAVPEQVAAFANPAGMTARVAADTILGQAAGLRTALAALGIQRMRKQEIQRAPNAETAQAYFDDAMARVALVAASLGLA